MKSSRSPSKLPLKAAPMQTNLYFDELTTTEVKRIAGGKQVIIIPIGSIEEHGKHLPLCTDSLQPEFVAEEVARRTGSLIAPPFRYGLCEAARYFPGTISIEFDTLRFFMRDVLSEFIRQGFSRLLVMSGHAGSQHMAALRLAAREVIQRFRDRPPESCPRIIVVSDYDFAYMLKGKGFDERDGHAGDIETSRMMAIRPALVKQDRVKSYPAMPRFEMFPDPEKYFPDGIVGDPTIATVEKGEMLNRFIIEEVVKLVEDLKK
jgi:creatinine amidohydrolase